jgi:hypothetical protein
METFAQSLAGGFAIVASCTILALTTLFLLQKFWPPRSRMAHNDMVGPSVGVIGTTYAVIIAFMLSGTWNEFQTAQVNAEQEANCLVNIYRFADRFPDSSGARIQQLAVDYAKAMIGEEWQAMEHESSSPGGHRIMFSLWRTLPAIEAQNPAQRMAVDHALTELTTMTEHRRIRLLQSHKQLPGILWAVLIFGGIITVASTCLFGVENFLLHMVQVFAIALLLSIMLVAIADIDRPFQGHIHVQPDGFRYAIDSFEEWSRAN